MKRSIFDPNAAALPNSGIFGLISNEKESKLILITVPWEATASYHRGTAEAPSSILQASKQVDLYNTMTGRIYSKGIFMLEKDKKIKFWNKKASFHAKRVIKTSIANKSSLTAVNGYSDKLNKYVYDETKKYLKRKKYVGVIGGDHSCAFGCIQAYVELFPHMGILQIDAHADLRKKFEGFNHSHASIMYNVISKLPIHRLVQVPVRDYCEEEVSFTRKHKGKIKTYFQSYISSLMFNGSSWRSICNKIISELPQEIYISFDIDGLDPKLCPNTGTPVPGGLDYEEIGYLLGEIRRSGKKIIGFDLCEVAPGKSDWDCNVGSRILLKLCECLLS